MFSAINAEKSRGKHCEQLKSSRFVEGCLIVPNCIGPSNKYIFRVGVGDILILLTV
jgi:hypothetical protein